MGAEPRRGGPLLRFLCLTNHRSGRAAVLQGRRRPRLFLLLGSGINRKWGQDLPSEQGLVGCRTRGQGREMAIRGLFSASQEATDHARNGSPGGGYDVRTEQPIGPGSCRPLPSRIYFERQNRAADRCWMSSPPHRCPATMGSRIKLVDVSVDCHVASLPPPSIKASSSPASRSTPGPGRPWPPTPSCLLGLQDGNARKGNRRHEPVR
jgi:hypothetical protein